MAFDDDVGEARPGSKRDGFACMKRGNATYREEIDGALDGASECYASG